MGFVIDNPTNHSLEIYPTSTPIVEMQKSEDESLVFPMDINRETCIVDRSALEWLASSEPMPQGYFPFVFSHDGSLTMNLRYLEDLNLLRPDVGTHYHKSTSLIFTYLQGYSLTNDQVRNNYADLSIGTNASGYLDINVFDEVLADISKYTSSQQNESLIRLVSQLRNIDYDLLIKVNPELAYNRWYRFNSMLTTLRRSEEESTIEGFPTFSFEYDSAQIDNFWDSVQDQFNLNEDFVQWIKNNNYLPIEVGNDSNISGMVIDSRLYNSTPRDYNFIGLRNFRSSANGNYYINIGTLLHETGHIYERYFELNVQNTEEYLNLFEENFGDTSLRLARINFIREIVFAEPRSIDEAFLGVFFSNALMNGEYRFNYFGELPIETILSRISYSSFFDLGTNGSQVILYLSDSNSPLNINPENELFADYQLWLQLTCANLGITKSEEIELLFPSMFDASYLNTILNNQTQNIIDSSASFEQ